MNNRRSKPHSEYLFKVLIFLFCITILLLLIRWAIIPSITGEGFKSVTFGEHLPITNPENFVVVLSINENDKGLSANVNAVILPQNSRFGKQICIYDIFVLDRNQYIGYDDLAFVNLGRFANMLGKPNGYLPMGEANPEAELWRIKASENIISSTPGTYLGATFDLEFNENFCTQGYDQVILSNELDSFMEDHYAGKPYPSSYQIPEIVLKPTSIPVFYYPFDRHSLDIMVWLLTTDGQIIAPNTIGLIYSPGWEVQAYNESGILNEDKLFNGTTVTHKITVLTIDFSRPLAYRLLNILLLILVLAFIMSLMFVKETANFLAISLGILFGLGGLTGILNFPNQTGLTLINAILLALYILFVFMIFMRMIIKPLWNSIEKHEPQAEQIKETKVRKRPKDIIKNKN